MMATHALLFFFTLWLVAASAKQLQGCPDGWYEYEGSCYQLQQGLTGVEEYRLVCQALGGDLVSIHSQEENDFVVALLAVDTARYIVWTWTSGECLGHDCSWSDGSAWDFQLFDEGQDNSGRWVVIDAEGWYDVRYDDLNNTDAICKV
jgi:hypothetical protein